MPPKPHKGKGFDIWAKKMASFALVHVNVYFPIYTWLHVQDS